jgi:hypothetical protein
LPDAFINPALEAVRCLLRDRAPSNPIELAHSHCANARSRDWVPYVQGVAPRPSVHREYERGRGRNSQVLEHHLVYEAQCTVTPSSSV